jgi:hypothetical protein
MLLCQTCAMPFDAGPETREIRSAVDGILEMIGVCCGCSPIGLTNEQWRAAVAAGTVEGRMPGDATS